MKTIWKFELPSYIASMPEGAEIIKAEPQNGVLCLWAICDPQAPRVFREFYVLGTGHSIQENLTHVASYQDPPFVWHLFERAPISEDSQRMVKKILAVTSTEQRS